MSMVDDDACQQNQELFVLGLTGSIGMVDGSSSMQALQAASPIPTRLVLQGKSTVARFFMELGVPVLDADQAVHDMYARGGAAVEPVGAAFPSALLDGAIDRKALSACVVGNEAALKQLEAIVHPLVAKERKMFLQQKAREGHQLVVLDIPLLYETGLENAVDAVAVVSAPADVQRQRVMARPGMTDEKFRAILSRQVPDADKRKRAEFCLDTSVPLEETREHVAALIRALRGRRGGTRPSPSAAP